MNKFARLLKKFRDDAFFKTYVLILFPVLIIFVFSFISTYSYNENYKEFVKHNYLTKLESICNESELSVQNIDTLIEFLINDMDENNFSSTKEKADFFSKSALTLSEVSKKNPFIDSIFLYDRDNRLVYSDTSCFNSSVYFYNDYCYAEYDKMYWDFYASPSSDKVTTKSIFAPSLVSTPTSSKIIIPIVFGITKAASSDLIVVNVNLSQIIINANKTKLTENSTFLVLNSKNRNIFNENNNFDAVLDENFYDTIFSDTSSVFDCSVNNKKTLVISYSTENSILGYYYVTLVPYSDINNNMPKITYFIILLGLIELIALLGITYFSTKKIYTPIENLASLFKNSSSSDEDDIDTLKRLHASIQETLDSNTNLSNEVSKALPLIQERFLINLLNSNEHYIPHDDSDLPVSFKHENFCSIVIKLRPTDMFYNLYNNSEYNAIKIGIHNIISSSFGEFYDAYIIPSEADTLYVLLNLPDDFDLNKIMGILEDFQKAMDFDKEYMTLKIGIGGIYPNLEGLKKSHHEAVNSVSTFVGLTHLRLYNDEEREKSSTYILSMNDENALLNHLILGRTKDATDLIDAILKNNVSNNISSTALMQLYIQLLNLVFKVMRMKNISYDTENSGDFHMITEIIKQPMPEVHDALIKYIEAISSYMSAGTSRVDIQAIISYMENNYSEDIGLDSIADNFNTTPKYLSKLIKDKLGVNFVDYLAALRINAAKVLLCETNKSINDIFVEVGFNNRNTFIRSFKKNTGLTPTEFRKSRKK